MSIYAINDVADGREGGEGEDFGEYSEEMERRHAMCIDLVDGTLGFSLSENCFAFLHLFLVFLSNYQLILIDTQRGESSHQMKIGAKTHTC